MLGLLKEKSKLNMSPATAWASGQMIVLAAIKHADTLGHVVFSCGQ